MLTLLSQCTWRGVWTWFICALFFMYEFLLRTVIGTFQQPIMHDLHLSSLQFALISSTSYLMVYGLMQIPVGFIADRWGLKVSLSVAACVCAVASISFACAHSWHWAIVTRMFIGLGSSFGFVCLLIAVYEWLPNQRIAFFIGLSQLIGTLGPMLAAGPLNALQEQSHLNWRHMFVLLGLLGFLLACFIALWVQNNHKHQGHYVVLHRPAPIRHTLITLLSRSQLWVVAVISACTYFLLEYLSENEGQALMALRGYSPRVASYLFTLSWLSYAVGCPIWGFLSDYMARRRPVLIAASWFNILALWGIVYMPVPPWAMTVSFILLGLGASGQSVGFALAMEQCDAHNVPAGLGFNNLMIVFVSSVNAPWIGWLLDQRSGGQMITLNDYRAVFYCVMALAGLALVLSYWQLKETFCKPANQMTYLKPTRRSLS